jgi:nucleoside-diphosphate-sugar epimerase
MKILMIGGTGFISSYLCHELVKRKHEVTLFNRVKSRPILPVPENVKRIIGDRNNPNDLKNTIQGKGLYDVVYDMTAYHGEQSRTAVKTFYGKTGRFIHCSTVSVYMISNKVRCPITEDQNQRDVMPYFPRNPFGMDYGIQKRECETILWQNHDPENFSVSMLRPTYVSGPGDPTLRDFFWIERIQDGKPLLIPGSGDFSFQQVYVKDVAKAFADLPEKDRTIGEAYNIAAEEIFTLYEYLSELALLMDQNPEYVHVNQDVFDRLPFSMSPRGDVFPFNTRRPAIFSLDKIKRDLNYHSTPFRQWMPDLIRWYLNRYTGHSHGYEDRDSEMKFAEHWSGYQQGMMKEFIHE